ncbi:MAG: L-type lectin-domain containing protein [Pseudomonadota bacterium]
MLRFSFLSGALFFLAAGAAQAAPVDFNDLQLNGTASLNAAQDTLTLTESADYQNGSAFLSSPVAITETTAISSAFELNFSSPRGGGADGIVFVVQSAPAGASALGFNGGGIGYEGITDSVAVEFDTWQNTQFSDPNGNHVGINLNGSVTSIATGTPGFTIETTDSLFAWVEYDGTTLDVFASTNDVKPGASLVSANLDLFDIVGPEAFVGFTASTGGASNLHQVRSFDLHVAPIPLPASLPLALLGVGALGLLRGSQRRA